MADVPFQAVLFDMDGTLVDTEPLWQQAERALMATFELEWTEAHHAHALGTSTRQVIDYMSGLVQEAGHPAPDPERMARRFLEIMAAQIESQPPPLHEGAAELLTDVQEHAIRAALVSSSSRALMDLVLTQLGSHWFEVTVSADDVDRHKPDPLPYLTAARQLEVDPAWCLAIEDSQTGSDAAQAAGAFVLSIADVVPIPEQPRRQVRDTLAGVTVATLAEMFEPPSARPR